VDIELNSGHLHPGGDKTMNRHSPGFTSETLYFQRRWLFVSLRIIQVLISLKSFVFLLYSFVWTRSRLQQASGDIRFQQSDLGVLPGDEAAGFAPGVLLHAAGNYHKK
jgi:hypothetical protein